MAAAPPALPTKKRNPLPLLLVTLTALAAVAGFVWTQPARRERALAAMTFPQLATLSKQNKNDPRVFYQMGLRLRSFGQLAPARAAFERAAELDDSDEEAWLAWAATAGNMGSEQEAFSVLSTYVKTHPRSPRGHMALALFYSNENALGRAVDESLLAAKLTPQDATAWRLAGASYLGLSSYIKAEPILRKAVKADPKDWRNQLSLGDALDGQGKTREALAVYQKASALAPMEGGVTLAMGRVMLNLAVSPADIGAARQVLARAAAQDTTSGRALLRLGQADMRLNHWAEARRDLEAAKALSPNASPVAFALQTVYTHLGDTVRAKQEAKRHQDIDNYNNATYNLNARLHDSDTIPLRLKLARVYASHGDYPHAIVEYKHLIARDPKMEAAKRELETLSQKAPQTAPAPLALAMPQGAGSGNSVETQLRDADAMLAQKRYPEAQAAYLSILQTNPTLARAGLGLGLAYEAQGKRAESVRVLSHALEIDPKLPEAQYALARDYFEMGFSDEARRRLLPLVQQAPGEAKYWHALGNCYAKEDLSAAKEEDAYGRAVTLAPQNASYLSDLGAAEERNAHLAQAETHLRASLQLAPDDVGTQTRLSALLLDHPVGPARAQEGEALLIRSLAAQPNNPEGQARLGRLRLTRGDAKGAVAPLEAAVASAPDRTQAWFALASAYDRLGNKPRANYCRLKFHQISDYTDTLSNTEEKVEQHLQDAPLRLKLARLYAKGELYAKAINQYQVYGKLAPSDPVGKSELTALTARLQKTGQMPDMAAFNRMVGASAKAKH